MKLAQIIDEAVARRLKPQLLNLAKRVLENSQQPKVAKALIPLPARERNELATSAKLDGVDYDKAISIIAEVLEQEIESMSDNVNVQSWIMRNLGNNYSDTVAELSKKYGGGLDGSGSKSTTFWIIRGKPLVQNEYTTSFCSMLTNDTGVEELSTHQDAISPYSTTLVHDGNLLPYIPYMITFYSLTESCVENIASAISNFEANKATVEETNINAYSLLSFMERFSLPRELGDTVKLRVDPMSLPGVMKVQDAGGVKVYIVTVAKSLAAIGEGTKWCTRFSFNNSTETAFTYISRSPQVVVVYGNRLVYQFAANGSEKKDVNDHNVDMSTLEKLVDMNAVRTGVLKLVYEMMLKPKHERGINDATAGLRSSVENPLNMIYDNLSLSGREWPEALKFITSVYKTADAHLNEVRAKDPDEDVDSSFYTLGRYNTEVDQTWRNCDSLSVVELYGKLVRDIGDNQSITNHNSVLHRYMYYKKLDPSIEGASALRQTLEEISELKTSRDTSDIDDTFDKHDKLLREYLQQAVVIDEHAGPEKSALDKIRQKAALALGILPIVRETAYKVLTRRNDQRSDTTKVYDATTFSRMLGLGFMHVDSTLVNSFTAAVENGTILIGYNAINSTLQKLRNDVNSANKLQAQILEQMNNGTYRQASYTRAQGEQDVLGMFNLSDSQKDILRRSTVLVESIGEYLAQEHIWDHRRQVRFRQREATTGTEEMATHFAFYAAIGNAISKLPIEAALCCLAAIRYTIANKHMYMHRISDSYKAEVATDIMKLISDPRISIIHSSGVKLDPYFLAARQDLTLLKLYSNINDKVTAQKIVYQFIANPDILKVDNA